MKKNLFCLLFPALFAVSSIGAAPLIEPVVISKRVQENPTIVFSGIPGDAVLSEEIESILRACGWFEVVRNRKAEYQLSGSTIPGGANIELTLGGASLGSWKITGRNARSVAKQAIDAVIERSFRDLRVRRFCNSRIAFCAQTNANSRNIFTCDIDGGDVQQITAFHSLCVEPAWFPDGKSIVYSKYNPGGMDVLQTMLQPRMTRILTRFRGLNAGAAVSPDGRNLALVLSLDHMVDLYVVPINGGVRTRLTRGIAVEASPCWSPDGRQIAYVSDEGGSPRIYTVGIRGGNRRRLPSIGSDAVTPDWSGNGKIVYAAKVNGSYTLGVFDTVNGTNKRVTSAVGNWESPAWAADNRQVVCKRTSGGKSALYVVDTWTGRVRLLVSTPYPLSMPVWSPCAKIGGGMN